MCTCVRWRIRTWATPTNRLLGLERPPFFSWPTSQQVWRREEGHVGFYKPTSLRSLSYFKVQPFLFGHFYWTDRPTEGVSEGGVMCQSSKIRNRERKRERGEKNINLALSHLSRLSKQNLSWCLHHKTWKALHATLALFLPQKHFWRHSEHQVRS